jgi:ABC-type lipoprotein release transport system permease subunit
MGAVVMLARSELRRRWRSVVVLTLLVAFIGAVVVALLGGARRTETSLARFEARSRSATLEIDVGETTPEQLATLRRVPGVVAVGELYQLTLVGSGRLFLPVAGQVDSKFGDVVDRARVIEGRAADQTRVDEVTIGESLAAELGLSVGDALHFQSYSPADIEAARVDNANPPAPHGPEVSLQVVGIVRRPLDLGGRGTNGGVVVPTKAFVERYRAEIGTFAGSLLRVRTEPGAANLGRVTRVAKQLWGRSEVFSIQSLSIEGQGAQDAIDVTTVGLYIAAAVAAITGFVGMGIALSREVALVDADQVTLSALGVRPRARVVAAAAVGLPVAIGGAILAIGGAVVASQWFPLGVAGEAEPDPGLRIDGPLLAIGALVIVLVVLAISTVAAMRAARVVRVTREPARPALATRAVAELGAPPPVAAGVRFALDQGSARPALPVRSSLIGAVFGVLVVVAVMVFAVSLDHLESTPAAYGWTWDTTAGDLTARQQTDNDCDAITTRLAREPVVSAVASICSSSVEIGGAPVTAWGFDQLKGRIEPLIVDGRAPATDAEVALGADTLSATGLAVGDRVRITGPEIASTFRIVGQTVVPGLSDPSPLSDVAAFTARGLARLGDSNGGWDFVVRFAPGVERADAVRRLRELGGPDGVPLSPEVPAEIDRVHRIEGLPVALGVFVAVVALVAVEFALVTAVRRRRRDLAVFKTLGFRRRQVRGTIAWHATTVACIGLLLGIPLGLAVGRLVWGAVAENLGVSTSATWPVLGIALLVPAALLVVNLLAAFPAHRAARTRPAVVLRSE